MPLFLRVADGNEADKAVFAQILGDFRKQLTLDTLMVADSALYSASNLALMRELKWLCRVPLTIKQALLLVSQITEDQFVKSEIEGYRLSTQTSNYGGIEQRWLVVESQVRRLADLGRLEQRLDKAAQEAHKKVQRLCAQKFTCPQLAIAAAQSLDKKLKYHKLTDIQVVELLTDSTKEAKKQEASVKATPPENTTYLLQASLVRDQNVIESETRCAGRFVLATNVLNVSELSLDEMLFEYKGQQSASRGFSELKDPLFFTDSVFLKSPERVESLAMLMGLCLLVYTLAQRQPLRLAQITIRA